MLQLEGYRFGIQANVERVYYRPGHRNCEMRFEHRRNVRQHQCNRVVFTDTAPL